jgi:hypothetical protein
VTSKEARGGMRRSSSVDGSSVLRFFGSSVLRFFGSSVLRFFVGLGKLLDAKRSGRMQLGPRISA